MRDGLALSVSIGVDPNLMQNYDPHKLKKMCEIVAADIAAGTKNTFFRPYGAWASCQHN